MSVEGHGGFDCYRSSPCRWIWPARSYIGIDGADGVVVVCVSYSERCGVPCDYVLCRRWCRLVCFCFASWVWKPERRERMRMGVSGSTAFGMPRLDAENSRKSRRMSSTSQDLRDLPCRELDRGRKTRGEGVTGADRRDGTGLEKNDRANEVESVEAQWWAVRHTHIHARWESKNRTRKE
ncbi:hypothetical protein BGZ61DRAFT_16359 [Ilyonectria robusta]|uniref:uncharacterized protein n=1 Tax=Ilyonectria robusta TaxID=1079257 RepID=UPI001E8D9B88|nr:uncharacterized protein BGZ61DRAFT_16359 [Ilyonectria robusta]KAH8737463.1 hypothetical protein BGZ61DRAFT_16359 [Ilyonectria robusta]